MSVLRWDGLAGLFGLSKRRVSEVAEGSTKLTAPNDEAMNYALWRASRSWARG